MVISLHGEISILFIYVCDAASEQTTKTKKIKLHVSIFIKSFLPFTRLGLYQTPAFRCDLSHSSVWNSNPCYAITLLCFLFLLCSYEGIHYILHLLVCCPLPLSLKCKLFENETFRPRDPKTWTGTKYVHNGYLFHE